MKDYKTFKDLNIGDTIYYYDHQKIKSKKIISEPKFTTYKEPIKWCNGYREWKILSFKTTPGKPIEIRSTWDVFNNYTYPINSSLHFSNKEAAETYINNLKARCKRKIKRANSILETQTRLLNKYKFEDGEE